VELPGARKHHDRDRRRVIRFSRQAAPQSGARQRAGPETARLIQSHRHIPAATSRYGLEIGPPWWIPGMPLAGVYHYFVYRHFAGSVKLEGEGY